MTHFFISSGVIILLLMFVVLYRVVKGPTPLDRILGVNVIGTKTMVLIVLIGTLYERVEMFVDIALTYALLNFIASLAAARFFQRHKKIHLEEEERGEGGSMLDILVIIFMVMGLFFFFGTTVGIVRFPDFYTRTHAAGKGDTLSVMLMLFGLALYNLHHLSPATLLVSGKIVIICVVVFIASPTATHAIMDAGYEAKVRHWSRPGAPKDPQDNSGEKQ